MAIPPTIAFDLLDQLEQGLEQLPQDRRYDDATKDKQISLRGISVKLHEGLGDPRKSINLSISSSENNPEG